MGGKVTALGMEVITEKSGHAVAPIVPSVCLTPAAPAPLPVPYPCSGTSREGIIGAPSRTKVNGAPIGTVGGALKACHGNEPGALKEIVSHNTGGAVAIVLGAPNVICELGMMGITGSPVLANKAPGGTMRCAPAPIRGQAPGAGGVERRGCCGGLPARGDRRGGDRALGVAAPPRARALCARHRRRRVARLRGGRRGGHALIERSYLADEPVETAGRALGMSRSSIKRRHGKALARIAARLRKGGVQ